MLAFFGGRPKQTQGLVTLATLYMDGASLSDLVSYKGKTPSAAGPAAGLLFIASLKP